MPLYKPQNRRDRAKFMQTLEIPVLLALEAEAKRRGLTMQEFVRAVVVPEWMEVHNLRPANPPLTARPPEIRPEIRVNRLKGD